MISRASVSSLLSLLVVIASVGVANAETRKTDVPDNFANVYMGFSSAGNTNLRIDNPKNPAGSGGPYSYDVANLKMKNGVWGGVALGHWFKQMPVSIGMSGTFDILPSAVKSQVGDATLIRPGLPNTHVNLLMAERELTLMGMGANLIVGVPLKFARPYFGIGPALFMAFHTIKFDDGFGNVTSASSMDAKLGYNAFFGADFFLTRAFSVFAEGKLSQVNNLDFQPYPSSNPSYHNKYDRIVTRRLAVGASFHF